MSLSGIDELDAGLGWMLATWTPDHSQPQSAHCIRWERATGLEGLMF